MSHDGPSRLRGYRLQFRPRRRAARTPFRGEQHARPACRRLLLSREGSSAGWGRAPSWFPAPLNATKESRTERADGGHRRGYVGRFVRVEEVFRAFDRTTERVAKPVRTPRQSACQRAPRPHPHHPSRKRLRRPSPLIRLRRPSLTTPTQLRLRVVRDQGDGKKEEEGVGGGAEGKVGGGSGREGR
jgi:hypothetical protein